MRSLEASEFRVRHNDTDRELVLEVAGELDMATAPKLWEALVPLLDTNKPIAIDLSGVTFLDSQGLNLLVRAHKRAACHDGRLLLRAPRPQARKLFQMTNLDEVFDVED